MNIAEAERRTGLTRANIRFYEKEGLLTPTRGPYIFYAGLLATFTC